MKEKTKRTWKEELKDTWDYCAPYLKVGATCLLVGAFWGFVKGVECQTDVVLGLSAKIPNYRDENETEDSFVYDETTVDDPELLELIRMENENT